MPRFETSHADPPSPSLGRDRREPSKSHSAPSPFPFILWKKTAPYLSGEMTPLSCNFFTLGRMTNEQ
jgi:hypothetical protein